jgi:hypothetical protein
MTRRVIIPEAALRTLVARYPFYAIAQIYKCDTRTVGMLAAEYGLRSAFIAKAPTEEEVARVHALAAEGLSIKKIAQMLGRSQDFVARRVREMPPVDDGDDDEGVSRDGWPVPDTTMSDALAGRRFEDASTDALLREWPAGRRPLNGMQLAAVGRFASRSMSRSTADLCAEDSPAL